MTRVDPHALAAQDTELADRYGKATLETLRRFQPLDADHRLGLRDSLDPGFAKAWSHYLAGLLARQNLEMRTRVLVLTGQFTMTRHHGRLRETVEVAVREGIALSEVLEVIVQCAIYGGDVIVDSALEVFSEVAAQHGLLEQVRAAQLPPDGTDGTRDLAAERLQWHPDDRADPRLDTMLDTYGWLGVSAALLQRPKWALDLIEFLDGLDEEFARLWLDATYHRMYGRMVLDDKTRVLCIVGDLLAIGEVTQSRRHMREALRHGAHPREILEIGFMGCAMFGHPSMLGGAVKDFLTILADVTGSDEVPDYPTQP